MTIDRGDYHFEDAQTWERACRHIGLFLWWASERGLASEDHHPAVLRCGATEHIILQCDTKLWVDDLNDAGNDFAADAYDSYLGEVTEYAGRLGVGDYDIPEADATTTHFFVWLDSRLAVFTSSSITPLDN